jgi:small conductance mechanosensitive channel
MTDYLQFIKDYISSHTSQAIVIISIIIVSYLIIKIVDKFLKIFFSKTKLDQTVESLMHKTIKAFLWAIVFILILDNMGVNVTAFIAGLGIIGFIIGFSIKDVLSNVMSGVFLFANKPFKIGDQVITAGITGEVKEMSLGACVVHTSKREYVMIPNSKIWGGPIINLSRLKKK